MAKTQPFRLEATYTPIAKRSCSRSHKRAHQPRNLHIRTLVAMTKATTLVRTTHGQLALPSKTRSQSQQSTCKDLKSKWPKPSHLDLRPLTLRLLSAPAHALHYKTKAQTLCLSF